MYEQQQQQQNSNEYNYNNLVTKSSEQNDQYYEQYQNSSYFNYQQYYQPQYSFNNNYNQYYQHYYQNQQFYQQYQTDLQQESQTQYAYQPQQVQKPSTPQPDSGYVQKSETTPEKPVMNDSGIVISPQLANTNQYQFNQVEQFNYQSNDIKKDTLQQAEAEENDDSIEDEEDEDEKENVEEEKANKSNSSKMNPAKPPKPYLEIIADAILSCNVKMMQLHEIYNYMEKKYQYFAKNVNKSWRNSVRHNLSLNECFVKAGRGSNGKGNYWKIHPLCEKEFIRGNFRRKSFKQMIRAGSTNNSNNNTNSQNFSVDYSLNYRSLIPQQLNSNSNPSLASFQFPTMPFSQEQLNTYNQQYNEQSSTKSDSNKIQRFHPYRI